MCLVVCFRLLVVCCLLANKDIYIYIAEGPSDASCQLKSCQLPCNSAETTCTTSPEQISYKVGGLQWDNEHSTMMRSSRFHCPIGVINKPTTVELWISPVYRRLAVAKFSNSRM